MLSKTTQQRIEDERGWITPKELVDLFSPLIKDFDTKLTRGAELRRDLIMTRLDNFKASLVRRCEQNLEREQQREKQSSFFGRTFGKTSGEQADGKGRPDDKISAGGEGMGERAAPMDADFGFQKDSGDSSESPSWRSNTGMGKAGPFSSE